MYKIIHVQICGFILMCFINSTGCVNESTAKTFTAQLLASTNSKLHLQYMHVIYHPSHIVSAFKSSCAK